jgi:hypothetical protein
MQICIVSYQPMNAGVQQVIFCQKYVKIEQNSENSQLRGHPIPLLNYIIHSFFFVCRCTCVGVEHRMAAAIEERIGSLAGAAVSCFLFLICSLIYSLGYQKSM